MVALRIQSVVILATVNLPFEYLDVLAIESEYRYHPPNCIVAFDQSA
ncbi:hypothetical protein VCHA34P116_20485 [Vibrio chagasii]|nr:hypothetical protein VCHA35O137_20039 [Vibrio chagasii]CAH6901300.1 hypothetical protein VCHA34P116_20485 [Vibrio chagasii]CAH6908434.1 hypothetical protein VCHA32P90_20485 [Vibrio chagasii]CAH7183929.1 hypothetical protein VCHA39P230_20038 [Vibrio chagasii]CAH7196484.1 hypothetical protein VCHA37P194_20038 [Vibrio chagasii]